MSIASEDGVNRFIHNFSSAHPSVGPSIGRPVMLSLKTMKIDLFKQMSSRGGCAKHNMNIQIYKSMHEDASLALLALFIDQNYSFL